MLSEMQQLLPIIVKTSPGQVIRFCFSDSAVRFVVSVFIFFSCEFLNSIKLSITYDRLSMNSGRGKSSEFYSMCVIFFGVVPYVLTDNGLARDKKSKIKKDLEWA